MTGWSEYFGVDFSKRPLAKRIEGREPEKCDVDGCDGRIAIHMQTGNLDCTSCGKDYGDFREYRKAIYAKLDAKETP